MPGEPCYRPLIRGEIRPTHTVASMIAHLGTLMERGELQPCSPLAVQGYNCSGEYVLMEIIADGYDKGSRWPITWGLQQPMD